MAMSKAIIRTTEIWHFFSQSSFFWAQPRNEIFFTWQKIWNLYNIFELIHFIQNYKQDTNTKKTCLFILLIQNNISQGKNAFIPINNILKEIYAYDWIFGWDKKDGIRFAIWSSTPQKMKESFKTLINILLWVKIQPSTRSHVNVIKNIRNPKVITQLLRPFMAWINGSLSIELHPNYIVEINPFGTGEEPTTSPPHCAGAPWKCSFMVVALQSCDPT